VTIPLPFFATASGHGLLDQRAKKFIDSKWHECSTLRISLHQTGGDPAVKYREAQAQCPSVRQLSGG
jgi:hypothetical protein